MFSEKYLLRVLKFVRNRLTGIVSKASGDNQ